MTFSLSLSVCIFLTSFLPMQWQYKCVGPLWHFKVFSIVIRINRGCNDNHLLIEPFWQMLYPHLNTAVRFHYEVLILPEWILIVLDFVLSEGMCECLWILNYFYWLSFTVKWHIPACTDSFNTKHGEIPHPSEVKYNFGQTWQDKLSAYNKN